MYYTVNYLDNQVIMSNFYHYPAILQGKDIADTREIPEGVRNSIQHEIHIQ